MFDDSYDEAIEYLKKELSSQYFVENQDSEPLYFHGWAHVKDLESITACKEFPQDSLYKHKGISVDLYRTKRMQLKNLESFLNKENSEYIQRRKSKGLIEPEEYEQRINHLKENIHKENPYKDSEEWVYNLVPLYRCHYMLEKAIFPLKKYCFNGEYFYGPQDSEAILSSIYGNYLQMPPEEKRRCHYSSVEFID